MPARAGELNANLTKGAAEAADVLRLLRLWNSAAEGAAAFLARAVEENLLGKASRARARDVVSSVVSRRYFPDGDDAPARALSRLARAEAPRDLLLPLLYYHAALAEPLLYRVATELLSEVRARGGGVVSPLEVEAFLRGLESRGAPAYSPTVRAKLSRMALTALRDFGVLEGSVRKRLAPVRVPHQVVGYVAHALRDEGESAKRIVEHPDWALFLLTSREAEAAILEGARHGHYTYSAAGDIRRFDWHFPLLDDYVDSLVAAHAAGSPGAAF